jgi:hypothetical protein
MCITFLFLPKKDAPVSPPVPKGLIVFSSHGTDVNTKDAIGVYDVETNELSDISFSAAGQPSDKYYRPKLSGDRSVSLSIK